MEYIGTEYKAMTDIGILDSRIPLHPIAAINTALNLDNVENSFNISGEQNQDEYQLHLLPNSASMKRIFQTFDLSLDRELFVRKTEMAQPNGDRVITTYTGQSRAVIPETTFEFKPPEITTVFACFFF